MDTDRYVNELSLEIPSYLSIISGGSRHSIITLSIYSFVFLVIAYLINQTNLIIQNY